MKPASELPRQHWDSQVEFVLSAVGFAIDLANVWRFPYLCYKYGGGAFLIPYIVCNIFQAMPLLYLEISLGQTQQAGCIQVWDVSPAGRGIGVAQCLLGIGMFYYNVMVGWCIFFFFNSFTAGELPWMTCGHDFNTPWCRTVDQFRNLSALNQTGDSVLSSVEYFERGLLAVHQSPNIETLGRPRFVLVACIFIAYAIIFFALWRGIKSSGKVVYITATMPVLLLVILLINGVQLPGATKGIDYYIRPDVSKIDLFAWIEASVQVFYSTAAGFGGHLSLSSYNKRSSNCYRDTIITIVCNACFSFLSGFVVFAYLGYMADLTNRSVEAVASDGPGLVFQVYPLAVGTLPIPQLWSCLFFFMLINLGVDSFMTGVETVLTGFGEVLLKFDCMNGKYFRVTFTFLYLLLHFLLALLLSTPGGMYVWNLQNNFVPGLSLIFIAFCDAVAIAWLYGLDEFCSDIKNAIGISPGIFWRITWKIISPAFILCIIVATIYTSFDTTSYLYFYAYSMYHPELFPNRTSDGVYLYFYSDSAKAIGWTLTLVQIAAIFLFAIIAIVQYRSVLKAISPVWQHAAIDSGDSRTRASWRHWLSLGPTNVFPLRQLCPAKLPVTDLTGQQSVDGEGDELQSRRRRQDQQHENGGYIGSEASAARGGRYQADVLDGGAIEIHYK
ncbi:hypothetical protein BOX15_Mlig022899g2 [Macrostomum lignano]|uniref:Transporter n=1 Tax=Macrostomum lignano TaxID=282301 RepID=A0A267E5S4_9PLAT|nr:hypothetical protein BOX15_Mlig022899g2 [Macrostomum lignano]